LADVYADQLPEGEGRPVYSGPIFDGATVAEDGAIRVTFKYTHDGLKIRNDEPDLLGFMICGEDGKFFPAAAKIDGQRVELRSLKVKKPKFVRFGWDKDNPPNLVNSQGLPASPFRTDDFDLISKGREF
jgi:sialate O-acetylesterase